MVSEARLEQTENGLVPRGEGWFVVNAREAPWWHSDTFGSSCGFEGDVHFPDLGINIQVLRPGSRTACTTVRTPRRTSSCSSASVSFSSRARSGCSGRGPRPLSRVDFVVFVGAGRAAS